VLVPDCPADVASAITAFSGLNAWPSPLKCLWVGGANNTFHDHSASVYMNGQPKVATSSSNLTGEGACALPGGAQAATAAAASTPLAAPCGCGTDMVTAARACRRVTAAAPLPTAASCAATKPLGISTASVCDYNKEDTCCSTAASCSAVRGAAAAACLLRTTMCASGQKALTGGARHGMVCARLPAGGSGNGLACGRARPSLLCGLLTPLPWL